ncbi:MAG: cytochrome c [Saprospiraceae bacterium]|nr:cytochrome c [Saprospiraceae bacterium]
MKRFFRILLLVVGFIVLAVGAFALYIQIKGVPKYPVAMTEAIKNLKVPVDSAHIAEGKRISSMLCRECHYSSETKKLTGSFRADIPKEFGDTYSLNITQDKTHGIGNWTDGELYYFLRTGIRPQTGQYVPPFMPKFPRMSEEDLHSVIAWLRSPDPELAADEREFPPVKSNFLIKLLCNMAFKPLPLPAQPIMEPDTTNKVALGKYVADGMIGCFACHSADLKTLNDLEPEKTPGFYGGGTVMLDLDGVTGVPTANITMDKATGIGNWTEQQFVDAVRYAKKPQGGLLHYPMLPHAGLSETEIRAVFAYLQTVPVIQNEVTRFQGK